MNNTSLFGGRLLEERTRLGLSQAEAANICGVSREMWGKYERDKSKMGTEVLSLFAFAGADVLYVLTGQRLNSVNNLNSREEALLDNYRHCDGDGQSAIEKVAFVASKYSTKDINNKSKGKAAS